MQYFFLVFVKKTFTGAHKQRQFSFKGDMALHSFTNLLIQFLAIA